MPAVHLTFWGKEEILVARRSLGPSSAQSQKLGYSSGPWGCLVEGANMIDVRTDARVCTRD